MLTETVHYMDNQKLIWLSNFYYMEMLIEHMHWVNHVRGSNSFYFLSYLQFNMKFYENSVTRTHTHKKKKGKKLIDPKSISQIHHGVVKIIKHLQLGTATWNVIATMLSRQMWCLQGVSQPFFCVKFLL